MYFGRAYSVSNPESKFVVGSRAVGCLVSSVETFDHLLVRPVFRKFTINNRM